MCVFGGERSSPEAFTSDSTLHGDGPHTALRGDRQNSAVSGKPASGREAGWA